MSARLFVALISHGSTDVAIWRILAQHIREHGLTHAYESLPYLNHPPIMAIWAAGLHALSEASGIRFAWFIKVPGLLGECLAAYLLYEIWCRKRDALVGTVALVLFAWNPATILLSGYHGSTDCLYAALALASAYCLVEKRRPFWGGLFLAAAINVKLIPILLVLPFTLHLPRWRDIWRFSSGVALAVLPFVPLAVVARESLFRNVFTYGSRADLWGIPGLLITDPSNLWQSVSAERGVAAYAIIGKYAIVLGIVAIAFMSRRRPDWTAYDIGAMCLAMFLFLAPGFGVQYTAAVVPLLFAVSLRYGSLYSWLCGAFLAVTYWRYLIPGEYPFRSRFQGPLRSPAPMWGMLAWFSLGLFLIRMLIDGRSSKEGGDHSAGS